MCHLLYLMFRFDGDVMESLESWEDFGYLNTPLVVQSKQELYMSDSSFLSTSALLSLGCSPATVRVRYDFVASFTGE